MGGAWTAERFDDLSEGVRDGFRRVDAEFAKVDKRFDQVDKRFEQEFAKIDRRFGEVHTDIRELRGEINGLRRSTWLAALTVIAALIAERLVG